MVCVCIVFTPPPPPPPSTVNSAEGVETNRYSSGVTAVSKALTPTAVDPSWRVSQRATGTVGRVSWRVQSSSRAMCVTALVAFCSRVRSAPSLSTFAASTLPSTEQVPYTHTHTHSNVICLLISNSTMFPLSTPVYTVVSHSDLAIGVCKLLLLRRQL